MPWSLSASTPTRNRAGQLGNYWVRIDVWTDNTGLHRYYWQRHPARNSRPALCVAGLGSYGSGAPRSMTVTHAAPVVVGGFYRTTARRPRETSMRPIVWSLAMAL
jgi:hypothetical protein